MLDPGNPLPLYQQLKMALRKAVEAGTWAPHEAIPPERELIDRYGVSRITVRQALSDLVSDGLLYRVHGKGTFVAARRPGPIAETLTSLTGHVEELQMRGLDPEVEVLGLSKRPLPAEVAAALRRSVGEEASWISRLITLDKLPLVLTETYIPAHLGISFTAEELRRVSVAKLLEQFGWVPAKGVQRISARRVDAPEARLLGVKAGEPVLQVVRIITGRDDSPLEWSMALYRADRYEYEVELRRNSKV